MLTAYGQSDNCPLLPEGVPSGTVTTSKVARKNFVRKGKYCPCSYVSPQFPKLILSSFLPSY